MNAKLKNWEKLIVMGYKLLLDIPYFLKIRLYTTRLNSFWNHYCIDIQSMLRFTLSIKYLKEMLGMSLN